MNRLIVSAALISFGCGGGSGVPDLSTIDDRDSFYRRAFGYVETNLERTAENSGDKLPYYTVLGRWYGIPEGGWTGGFFPGQLWLLYRKTGEEKWERWARHYSQIVRPNAGVPGGDKGYNFNGSFALGYRITGDEDYRRVALTAVESLARRYYEPGKFMWYVRRDPPARVIIDAMINMELLLFGSELSGDLSYREMAINHSLFTLRNHVREDGSSYQVLYFDPETLEVVEVGRRQGFTGETCWSRGQAWGIYGFTRMYEATKDERFLKAADLMVDYHLRNAPDDGVPYWDYEAPNIPVEPRDSSAGTCICSALFDLARLAPDAAARKKYRQAAVALLDNLTKHYLSWRFYPGWEGLIGFGTVHMPERVGINESSVWGDYFYVEALLKYMEERGI